jgi:hypothetical protein
VTSAQEARADGWQRDAARYLVTIDALARDKRELTARLAEIAGRAAVIAAWLEHLPMRHVPVRVGLALAELQRLTGATEPPAAAARQPRPQP